MEKAHGHLPVEEADRVFPRVNLTYVYYAFEEFKLLKSARA